MNIQTMIDRCEAVVVKWSQRSVTGETVEDFAHALGLKSHVLFEPSVFSETLNKAYMQAPDVVAGDQDPEVEEPQYKLFNELSVEDKYAMKSWRKNNGL